MGCVRVCSVPFVKRQQIEFLQCSIAAARQIVPQLQRDCTNLKRKSFHQGSRSAMQQFYFRDKVGSYRAQALEIF
jgi:hypothetical protein